MWHLAHTPPAPEYSWAVFVTLARTADDRKTSVVMKKKITIIATNPAKGIPNRYPGLSSFLNGVEKFKRKRQLESVLEFPHSPMATSPDSLRCCIPNGFLIKNPKRSLACQTKTVDPWWDWITMLTD
jgi:hypothetical protein